VVRVGVQPPVPALRIAEREHVEHELADDLGRVEAGQAGGDAVEHDDAAGLVGDHDPVRKLVGENQAADRDRAFGKWAVSGTPTVGGLVVRRRPGQLRGRGCPARYELVHCSEASVRRGRTEISPAAGSGHGLGDGL
jgi:hypothetical protein